MQLGRCFDLMDTQFTAKLLKAYELCEQLYNEKGKPLPTNDGKTPDKKLRRLDCLVLNLYLQYVEDQTQEKFQTVRGASKKGTRRSPAA